MNNKLLYIIIGILCLVLGGVIALAVVYGGGSSVSPGTLVIVPIASFVPIFAAISSVSNPSTPAYSVINCLKESYPRERRIIYFKPYLTNAFISSAKYDTLLSVNIDTRRSRMKVEQSADRQNASVIITLKDGRKYIFDLITRDRRVDPQGSTRWAINDIRGEEFGL